jgi:hypothetical protein
LVFSFTIHTVRALLANSNRATRAFASMYEAPFSFRIRMGKELAWR